MTNMTLEVTLLTHSWSSCEIFTGAVKKITLQSLIKIISFT